MYRRNGEGRLLVGPFHNDKKRRYFYAPSVVHIPAFTWTRASHGQGFGNYPKRMTFRTLAAQPSSSRGRAHPETDRGPRGPRDIFQRDRDRIIHSVSFRRLVTRPRSSLRRTATIISVRLTHSIEVAKSAVQSPARLD